MSINKRHFRIISGALDGGLPTAAIVVVALLLLIAAVNGTFTTNSVVGPVVHGASPAPGPTETFVYFPSQYVNQATEVEEHIQAF